MESLRNPAPTGTQNVLSENADLTTRLCFYNPQWVPHQLQDTVPVRTSPVGEEPRRSRPGERVRAMWFLVARTEISSI